MISFRQYLEQSLNEAVVAAPAGKSNRVQGVGGLVMPSKKDKELKRKKKHGGSKKDSWRQFAE